MKKLFLFQWKCVIFKFIYNFLNDKIFKMDVVVINVFWEMDNLGFRKDKGNIFYCLLDVSIKLIKIFVLKCFLIIGY